MAKIKKPAVIAEYDEEESGDDAGEESAAEEVVVVASTAAAAKKKPPKKRYSKRTDKEIVEFDLGKIAKRFKADTAASNRKRPRVSEEFAKNLFVTDHMAEGTNTNGDTFHYNAITIARVNATTGTRTRQDVLYNNSPPSFDVSRYAVCSSEYCSRPSCVLALLHCSLRRLKLSVHGRKIAHPSTRG
ncbi:MAG TPA: hypothetical protein EYO76_03260 [Flavobacteriaceae bacterium]|nr:hypothetical protein [Flavobacteriaceae bacterium]